MKNIHLVPTDKPSRLHMTGSLGLYPDGLVIKPRGLCKNQYIYITSLEEIKEGDWFYDLDSKYIKIKQSWENSHLDFNGKKIILTTDQDLIKDGVQAIDEEFLQWFVKNQSCEEVEIELKTKQLIKPYDVYNELVSYYNIIIPKEEPKQENCCTPIGQMKRYHNCHGCDRKPTDRLFFRGVDFTNPNADKISSASTITKEEQKQHLIDMMNGHNVQVEKPFKETIEEAAERMFKEFQIENPIVPNKDIRPFKVGFIKGAKWQQERTYSEEDIVEFNEWLSSLLFVKDGNYLLVEKTTKELLQLWKEQKLKTIYYE